MQISQNNLVTPNRMGQLSVSYENQDFYIKEEGSLNGRKVQRADVAAELRGVPENALKKMLNHGYLTVNPVGPDYAIRFSARVNGGGFFGAMAAYVATNIVGGAMVLGGTLLAVPTGGASLALVATGASVIAAAPTVLIVALPLPTP